MRNYRELLIVVGVLATVLICGATLKTSMDKQVFCQNNLKKLYQYNAMYQKDYGELPPVYVAAKPLWLFWTNYLKNYLEQRTDMACPEDPKAQYLFKKSNPLLDGSVKIRSSYGMNYFLTRHYAKKKGFVHPKLENLSQPGQVVFLGDSKGPYMLPERFWTYEKAMRHEKSSANFIFADGAVKNMVKNDFGKIGANGKFKTNMAHWLWN